jgi:hypothetical protein
MAKKYPKPIFKPRELKKLFEDQWYVEAEWPDGLSKNRLVLLPQIPRLGTG